RFSRKLVYQAAQIVMILASLGLAALSFFEGPVPLIYACLVLSASARAFIAPARGALVPQVVPQHLIANAVTWNSSGWQIANMTGPALGGLMIWLTGEYTPAYLLAAACALSCVVLVMPIRPKSAAPSVAETFSLASVLMGVRFVWRTKLLLAV